MKLKKSFNFKKILSLFLRRDGTPAFNAKGIAVGVFCGCFPFFGFQTILGLFLARLVRGNLVLAALGTWISNPFTYIPLYFLNYQVGTLFIKTKSNIIFEKNLLTNGLWEQGSLFSLRLLLGSSLVGLLLGSISGCIVFLLNKRKLNNKS